eukprot:TRINITY_DN16343_c0_g1_i1.p1 TRINITY_DN16343_c0_g1~~TRINITY_DN16343_c0_g1_i1.p1  ORF type:complete len:528 (-),score=123.39 TRINITY_DN16343_c0_g1_i1:295-1878(-)
MAEETPAEPPPPAAAPEGEQAPKGVQACMDLTEFPLKNDYFDGMHMLPETVEKIESAPNFRQVSGFPVFGVGQPTEEGFVTVLEKTKNSPEDKPGKIIWFNTRKEPVVYINGNPYAPRDPADLHRNINISYSVEQLDHLEKNLAEIVTDKSQKNNQTVKVHKDLAFCENPMEREEEEVELKVEQIKGLQNIYDTMRESGFAGLTVNRIPITEERAPAEYCFDMMLDILKNEPASVPCVFSDQMGRGRTTLGMVIACLIKEIQITSELRRMEEIDLVSKDTVKELIQQKFESALPKCQDDDDPFIKGEFDVIKELLEKFPSTVEGKKKIDRVLDICGPTPKGTGLQNLRECVIETKWKYDVASEDKQVAWKQLILDFMERYFYLICFATYCLEEGPGGYNHSFSWWMDEHKDLRSMIDQGKDKLEWYRTVDAAKLEHLKDMMSAPNYKENLGTLIRTIYDFAFVTYADLPRGPIKNNSMRRLAATTLLDILPPDIADRVNKKMEEDPNGSHDFLTLVGLVSYYGADDD